MSKSNPVTIYSTPLCPYCIGAKNLLESKDLAYTEIGMMSLSSDEKSKLMTKTNNYRTVPQIFIGDTFIGGFDDLNKLNKEGKLDEMLAS